MKHSKAFEDLVAGVMGGIKEISPSDVVQYLDKGESFDFIDVREDHEWTQGHARGAKHLGRGIIERDIEKVVPDKEAMVVLYCGGGYRSALAADNLQKMGYKNVLSMQGGIRLWRELGLPEDKD
jgi:rhodanese-related sulfurtransferase